MLIEDERITFRVVVIGSSSVGKTSIINKFLHDKFNDKEPNTVGALYESFEEERNGQQMTIQIWDTAGQEQYRSLATVYFRGAAGAIIVYDVTNTPSFNSLEDWLKTFRNSNDSKTVIFVVGNKCDLSGDRRILADEACKWAESKGCIYIETSAATGENIDDLFKQLVDELAKSNLEGGPRVLSAPKRLQANKGEEKKGCC